MKSISEISQRERFTLLIQKNKIQKSKRVKGSTVRRPVLKPPPSVCPLVVVSRKTEQKESFMRLQPHANVPTLNPLVFLSLEFRSSSRLPTETN